MKLDLLQIHNYRNLEFLAKQLVEGFITGLHKSPYHGFSVEFAEHRPYNIGESIRHIDWKVFARTDKLYTKRYEEETNLRCQIVLDNSSSMYYPVKSKGKITFSLVSTVALTYLLQTQRDAVGISTFSNQIEIHTQIKSTTSHRHKLFMILQKLLDETLHNKRTSVANVLHEIAEKNHKRSLIIIFSDMFEDSTELEGILGALQHLKHNNHEVLIFHVTDRMTEYKFNFEERPHEFIDLESGERLRIQPSQVKDTFEEQMDQYYHELKIKCGLLKIDFVQADVNDDYNNILYTYLVKRAKMK